MGIFSKDKKDKVIGLTEQEKKELELLDDPKEQRMGNIAGGLPAMFFNSANVFMIKSKRRERVSELRTKMRMAEEGFDWNKDWNQYYRIKAEEEKRFDERFRDFK